MKNVYKRNKAMKKKIKADVKKKRRKERKMQLIINCDKNETIRYEWRKDFKRMRKRIKVNLVKGIQILRRGIGVDHIKGEEMRHVAAYERKKPANLQMLLTESNYDNTSRKCNKRLSADFISFTCRSFHLWERCVDYLFNCVFWRFTAVVHRDAAEKNNRN